MPLKSYILINTLWGHMKPILDPQLPPEPDVETSCWGPKPV